VTARNRSRSRTYPFHYQPFVPERGGGEKRGSANTEFIHEESRMLSELSPRLIGSDSECALGLGHTTVNCPIQAMEKTRLRRSRDVFRLGLHPEGLV